MLISWARAAPALGSIFQLREYLNGIQEVNSLIPLVSTDSGHKAEALWPFVICRFQGSGTCLMKSSYEYCNAGLDKYRESWASYL